MERNLLCSLVLFGLLFLSNVLSKPSTPEPTKGTISDLRGKWLNEVGSELGFPELDEDYHDDSDEESMEEESLENTQIEREQTQTENVGFGSYQFLLNNLGNILSQSVEHSGFSQTSWLNGPNVCTFNNETIEYLNAPPKDGEDDQHTQFTYGSTTRYCANEDHLYICKTIRSNAEKIKTMTVTKKCCHGNDKNIGNPNSPCPDASTTEISIPIEIE